MINTMVPFYKEQPNPLFGIDVLVFSGSVDGTIGASACYNLANNVELDLICKQPNEVGTIDMSGWLKNSKVAFFNLAVNNENNNTQITNDFVKKIYDLGHKILLIIDEHDKDKWQSVFKVSAPAGAFDALLIKPENRNEHGEEGSSSAILLRNLGDKIKGTHIENLLKDGHEADQTRFDTKYGTIFNNSIKSDIKNNQIRLYLARHFGYNTEADEKILGFMANYKELEDNKNTLISKRTDVRVSGKIISGMAMYDAADLKIDVTSFFNAAYKKDSVVVLKNVSSFINGANVIGTSIGTNRSEFNVLKTIQDANIVASGFSSKANFAKVDEEAAINAVVNRFLKL